MNKVWLTERESGPSVVHGHPFHAPIEVIFVSLAAIPQLNPINITLVTLADDGSTGKVAQVTIHNREINAVTLCFERKKIATGQAIKAQKGINVQLYCFFNLGAR
jgi:hypothetical protein